MTLSGNTIFQLQHKIRHIIYIFILSILFLERAQAQVIKIYGIEQDSVRLNGAILDLNKINERDTFLLFHPVERFLDTLHSLGYYSAALDSMVYDTAFISLYFYQGDKFVIDRILINSYKEMIKADTVDFIKNDTLNPQKVIINKRKELLGEALLLGYPFAAFRLIPHLKDNGHVDLIMDLQPGKLYPIGGLHVVGNLKISEYYIERMIDLQTGFPYSPVIMDKASKKIRELTFAEQYKMPIVVFAEDKAYLALFLNRKNVNRFDLLIGVQPNTSNIPGVSNRLLLTGNATIELINQFGQGEKIVGEYFQPSAMNQQLRLEGEYPFILNTPIGIKSSFRLYRADSAFLEKIFEVGAQYYFNYDSKMEAFWNRNQSDIGTVDTQTILLTKKLPANLDYKTDYFGLDYNIQKLDFRLNPRKGFSIALKMGVGKRNIIKNDKILSLRATDPEVFDYASLYDTVTLTTTLFKPQLDAKIFIPIFKRLAIMFRTNGGLITGPKQIYSNEKFRIGGNKTFRGWNEQSIYSAGFLIATTELKMVLDELGSLFLFADNGFINNSDARFNNFRWNIGVGAGINFGTKVGVFGLSVAVGKNKTIPFDFQAAKIHFGYQSVF